MLKHPFKTVLMFSLFALGAFQAPGARAEADTSSATGADLTTKTAETAPENQDGSRTAQRRRVIFRSRLRRQCTAKNSKLTGAALEACIKEKRQKLVDEATLK